MAHKCGRCGGSLRKMGGLDGRPTMHACLKCGFVLGKSGKVLLGKSLRRPTRSKRYGKK